MRTHKHTAAKAGEVIQVAFGTTGRPYGDPIIITDKRAGARQCPIEGGYECRTATKDEIKAAGKNIRTVYE